MTKEELNKMINHLNYSAKHGRYICWNIEVFLTGSSYLGGSSPEARELFSDLFVPYANDEWFIENGWTAEDHLKDNKRTAENKMLVRYSMIDIFKEICLDTEIYKYWEVEK